MQSDTARFISFEGIDGAGKSSHIQLLADWLVARGQRVLISREPGGTPLGEKLRALLLADAMHVDTEALIAFAARNEHLRQQILPALQTGQWVLCDRFTDSTLAYQGGGKGADLSRLRQLADWTHGDLAPGRSYFFDLAPAIASQRRANSRSSSDKFEQESSVFFNKVRHTYQTLAATEPGRFVCIDASESITEVAAALEKNFATYAENYLI